MCAAAMYGVCAYNCSSGPVAQHPTHYFPPERDPSRLLPFAPALLSRENDIYMQVLGGPGEGLWRRTVPLAG